MIPRHTWPVARRSALKVKWSVPARLVIRRWTLKEPLVPAVFEVPRLDTLPSWAPAVIHCNF